MAAKLMAGIDLLSHKVGLFWCEEARVCLASHGTSEAVVRTVASLGVSSTGATRFAALDRTFGQRTAAHGPGIGHGGRKLEHFGRGRSRHGSILLHMLP
jgi:hypothetical protein